MICAWTSRPTTTSHSPVSPLMRKSLIESVRSPRVRAAVDDRISLPPTPTSSDERTRSPTTTPARVKPAALLDREAGVEHHLLVELVADQVQAERQALPVEPARDAHRRQAGEARRDREHVVQIHRQRVGRLADAERGRGRGRGQDHVALLERLAEILLDQRAHLLRLGEIGVVEAGRQHVGADHDPALDLGAEARRARRRIHVVERLHALDSRRP